MSFLSPIWLLALPLALLPVIIHLIHLLRRRQVKWAAMMFLRKAQRMHKGLSKLRQYLILACRVLAVAAILLVIARPLAGGLLGLTGGAPDTVVILLDRSASMEEQLLEVGQSKREAALTNLKDAIDRAYGKRSQLVLIDSATRAPVLLENAEALTDLPQSGPTATSADIPGMMQACLDYLTANESGRTDVWLVSDLREPDWDPNSGRWDALRSAFASLPGVRFQLLAYPERAASDLGIVVENLTRRNTADGAELLLDIRLRRVGLPSESTNDIPIKVVVNEAVSTLNATLSSNETLLQGQSIPIDKGTIRGWGRVELPADGVPANNQFHFVFDQPAPLASAIVSDNDAVIRPLQAALSAPANRSREHVVEVVSAERAAEIPWESTALIVWQAPFPEAESPVARQLEAHVSAGRTLMFLPPDRPDNGTFADIQWNTWESSESVLQIDWWRHDSDLLAATRSGKALPVGELTIQRYATIEGTLTPLARLSQRFANAPILAKASLGDTGNSIYFLTVLPGPGQSSLASEGVVLYATLQRALASGALKLGRAQVGEASPMALGNDPEAWKALGEGHSGFTVERSLQAGVLEHTSGETRLALNRPASEDDTATVTPDRLGELFSGLDWRLLERTLDDDRSLASEVWRTFLMLMGAAILLEALLCMPRRRAQEDATPTRVAFTSTPSSTS